MVPLLQRAVGAWLGTAVATLSPAGSPASLLLGSLAPVYWLSLCAFLLLALSLGFFLRQQSFPEPGREKRPATWGCGYREATPRMQYTAVSFAELLVSLFRWGLWSDIAGGRAIGFFPAAASLVAHTPDLVLDRLIHPSFRALSRAAFATRAFLHQGWIGVYLLYSAVTLCLLLLWL
jgi:hypothetical protein